MSQKLPVPIEPGVVAFQGQSGTNHVLKIAGFLPMMGNDHIRVHRQVSGGLAHQFGAFRL